MEKIKDTMHVLFLIFIITVMGLICNYNFASAKEFLDKVNNPEYAAERENEYIKKVRDDIDIIRIDGVNYLIMIGYDWKNGISPKFNPDSTVSTCEE